MKKLTLTIGLLIFGFTTVWAQNKDQLPQNVQQFLSDNYSSEKVEKAKVDRGKNDRDDRYEVKLSNGISLEFNESGEVTEIDGDTRIPDGALPSNVVSYVNENYSNAHIREWELDETEQEVELNNGVELVFDKNGKFIKKDD